MGSIDVSGLIRWIDLGNQICTGHVGGEIAGHFANWIAQVRQELQGVGAPPEVIADWMGLPVPVFEDCKKFDPRELYNAASTRNAWLATTIRHLRQSASVAAFAQEASMSAEPKPKDKRSVFVVHGRDQSVRDAVFTFLRAIGLEPMEWSVVVRKTGKAAPYIGEILDRAYSEAQAVVVLMTPDDEARLHPDYVKPNDPPHEKSYTPQARPNVLFEAGMAMGRFPDRTILVEVGNLRPFSDIGGRHTLRLDNSTQRRQELAMRLQDAGCPVNLEGTDWHTAGNFRIKEKITSPSLKNGSDSQTNSRSTPRPKLVVPREQASQKIRQEIAKWQAIAASPVATHDDAEQLNAAIITQRRYTRELLGTLFKNDASLEFGSNLGRIKYGMETPEELAEDLHHVAKVNARDLESILQRIDLFEEAISRIGHA